MGRVGPHVRDVPCLVELSRVLVFLTLKPRRVDAACCSVDVMKGAPGRVVVGLSSRLRTTKSASRRASRAFSVSASEFGRKRLGAAVDLEAGRGALYQQVCKDLNILPARGADLSLPFYDEAHRHGLHARRTGPGPAPEQRRDHVAHHPIQETPSLLCMD